VLKADSSKAKKALSWTPRISFEDLIMIMVDADLEAIGLSSPGEGKKIRSPWSRRSLAKTGWKKERTENHFSGLKNND
jgi:hypothetical protein